MSGRLRAGVSYRKMEGKGAKSQEKGEGAIRSEKLRAGEKGRKRHTKPRKGKEKAQYAVKS